MNKPLVYHCEADVEIIATTKYYECQRQGLGRGFLCNVRSAADTIQKDPERFPFYGEPARSCRVGGFPYRLVYIILPEAIQVVAVMHLHRKPGYWKQRIS